MNNEVVVIRTGSANLASMQAGLLRAGAVPVLTESPEEVRAASQVVLPGVGTLGQTKHILDETGLTPVIQARVREGRALFAVCVGLHLLFDESEESPSASGLGVVPGTIRRFPPEVRVPQFGWNHVEVPEEPTIWRLGNTILPTRTGWWGHLRGYRVATAHHGGEFIAAFERGGLLACQFHPELSAQSEDG